jgi:hypothetical protein
LRPGSRQRMMLAVLVAALLLLLLADAEIMFEVRSDHTWRSESLSGTWVCVNEGGSGSWTVWKTKRPYPVNACTKDFGRRTGRHCRRLTL